MPVLTYGTSMGWISPNADYLMSEDSPFTPLSANEVSWLGSVMFIFAPISVFIFGAAADRYGRKNAQLACTVPMAVSIRFKIIKSFN